jgi:hypothetical protein
MYKFIRFSTRAPSSVNPKYKILQVPTHSLVIMIIKGYNVRNVTLWCCWLQNWCKIKIETRVQCFMLLYAMYAYKHPTTSCMIQEDLCMSTSVDTGSSHTVRKTVRCLNAYVSYNCIKPWTFPHFTLILKSTTS